MAGPRFPTRAAGILPILGMAILAGVTYWLLQASIKPGQTQAPKVAAHTPDYYADNFAVTMIAPTGLVKYRLNAKTMVHYEDDQTTHLTLPAMRAFQPNEPIITATSKVGTVNSDGSIINLDDNAQVVREPGPKDPKMQANSEHFTVLVNEDVVRTEKPVKLLRGQSISTADGMIYTNTTRNMELLGTVRGLITPQQLNGKASQ
jgi:lipopolysaccharide export system protein LptC